MVDNSSEIGRSLSPPVDQQGTFPLLGQFTPSPLIDDYTNAASSPSPPSPSSTLTSSAGAAAPTSTRPRMGWAQVMVLSVLNCVLPCQELMLAAALPTICSDPKFDCYYVDWVNSTFMMVAVVTAPALTKTANIFGRKRVIAIALVVYFLSTLLAGFAVNLPMLIACRLFQGGAAGLGSITLGEVKEHGPEGADAILFAMSNIGIALGIVLGGVITQLLPWKYLFFFISGVIFLVSILSLVLPISNVRRRVGFDYMGAIQLGAGSFFILLGISQGDRWRWDSPGTLMTFALGFALLWSFCLWESIMTTGAKTEPLIRVDTLKKHTMVGVTIYSVFNALIQNGMYQSLPFFLEAPKRLGGQGIKNKVIVGLILVSTPAAYVLLCFLVRHLSKKKALVPKILCCGAAGLAVVSAAFVWVHDTWWKVSIMGFILGVALVHSNVPAVTMIKHYLPSADYDICVAILYSMRFMGQALGPIVIGAIQNAFGVEESGTIWIPEKGMNVIWFTLAGAGGLCFLIAISLPGVFFQGKSVFACSCPLRKGRSQQRPPLLADV